MAKYDVWILFSCAEMGIRSILCTWLGTRVQDPEQPGIRRSIQKNPGIEQTLTQMLPRKPQEKASGLSAIGDRYISEAASLPRLQPHAPEFLDRLYLSRSD